MLIFQNTRKRDCASADYKKANYRIKRQFNQSYQNTHDNLKQTELHKQNIAPQCQSYQAPKSDVDPYRQHMKFLIGQNSQYFQYKIKVTDKIRPNQYRFKIPTQTPSTIYKKHFDLKKKNLSVDNLKLNRNNLSHLIQEKDPNQKILFKTSYQKQFGTKRQTKHQTNSKHIQQKNSKRFISKTDEDVPRFMETQNNCFFLNWGGKNSTTSLKPSYQTVSTNLPFDGRTVYNNDFKGKVMPKTKIIMPESSMPKFSGCLLINKSNYTSEFSNKEKGLEVQKSCKPRNIGMKTSQMFRGTTQYRSEYKNEQEQTSRFSSKIKTKQQLQALILDL